MQQDKYLRGNDTCNDSTSCPVGSTVAVQRWWTVEAWGDCREQQGRPQWAVVHSESDEDGENDNKTRHIRKTPIIAEQYLREQTVKSTVYLEDIHRQKLNSAQQGVQPIYSMNTR